MKVINCIVIYVVVLNVISEPLNDENEEVHDGYCCDGCGVKPIRGMRYRCSKCSSYDLCNNCRSRGIHKRHTMERRLSSNVERRMAETEPSKQIKVSYN